MEIQEQLSIQKEAVDDTAHFPFVNKSVNKNCVGTKLLIRVPSCVNIDIPLIFFPRCVVSASPVQGDDTVDPEVCTYLVLLRALATNFYAGNNHRHYHFKYCQIWTHPPFFFPTSP